MTDCITGINMHFEDQTLSLYDQWIQESSLHCGSQGVIQMTGVPYTCMIFWRLPLTFKYLRCFPPERLVEGYNIYISRHGRTHLA